MKCNHCGKENSQDSAFCVYCGGKIEGNAEETKVSKIKLPKKALFGGLAVIAVGAAGVFGLVKAGGNSSSETSKALAYLKDGKIYYTDNMEKDKDALCVCEVKGTNDTYNSIRLSENGKYIYYYSRVNDDYNGTLSRAEVGRLSDDEDKNEKYIDEFASDVKSYDVLSDGEKCVYLKDNGKLVFFDGKNEEDIAREVEYYSLSKDEKTIYYKNKENTYYVFDFNSSEAEKLAENVNRFWGESTEYVLYTVLDNEGNEALYMAKDGEEERISADLYEICSTDMSLGRAYYIAERKENTSLYEWINDVYAEADAQLSEPSYYDYMTEITESEAMSESDYEYYNIRYPEDKVYFYEYLYFNDEWNLYYYEKESYDELLGKWNYEDCYYNDLTNQWFLFDNEKYYEDMEAYNDAKVRIELRAELKENTLEHTQYDLYYVEKEKEAELVAENIITGSVFADAAAHVAVYRRYEAADTPVKISMDDVRSVSEAMWKIEEAEGEPAANEEYYCRLSADETVLDGEGEIYYVDVSTDGKTAMIRFGNNADNSVLYQYTVKNGTLESGDKVAECVAWGRWREDGYYYFKDVIDGYGSAYFYKNGDSKKVLSNVYTTDVRRYEDGNYLAYKDYDGQDGGSLRIYGANGDEIKVASGVENYAYITEKCILYKKNDALYVYTGKEEDRRIARDVDDYWYTGMSYDWF